MYDDDFVLPFKQRQFSMIKCIHRDAEALRDDPGCIRYGTETCSVGHDSISTTFWQENLWTYAGFGCSEGCQFRTWENGDRNPVHICDIQDRCSSNN